MGDGRIVFLFRCMCGLQSGFSFYKLGGSESPVIFNEDGGFLPQSSFAGYYVKRCEAKVIHSHNHTVRAAVSPAKQIRN